MIKKILLVVLSTVITFLLLILSTNYYLRFTGKGKTPEHIGWTVAYTTYDPRYIFWQRSWCHYSNNYCQTAYQEASTLQVRKYNESASADCMRVLFLGDSFSIALTSPEEHGYMAEFSEQLSKKLNTCIEEITVSSGGVGTSQELARFEDVVEDVSPSIVVWQFYWNDVYDNIQKSLHSVENNTLHRNSSRTHPLFIAGFLNQKIPFLKDSTLGKHLLYIGEKHDLFRQWPANPEDDKSVIAYNELIVPLFIKKMDELSEKYDFKLYTTLSPLECEYSAEKESDRCRIVVEYQQTIRDVLQQKSEFISMESTDSANVLGVISDYDPLFTDTERATGLGWRHLSPEGEKYFGGTLFHNYLNRELHENK